MSGLSFDFGETLYSFKEKKKLCAQSILDD